MRRVIIFGLLLTAFVAVVADVELPLAEECDEEKCKLPDCRCSSTNIPGGLLPRNTPQFVSVTFDDAINVRSIATYRDILYNRINRNGCPAGATFFINHEYNNYQFVNELYNQGFEIALHSMTHRYPKSFWETASYEYLKLEFADQRKQMAYFASIPYDEIQGIRLPFLQMSGNTSFAMMADHGFLYDATWPTVSFTRPGLWPYTLDYASIQDCSIPPCPTASIPGPWVLPIVTWSDLQGVPCSMLDACFFVPQHNDEDAWYRLILTNFERHYLGNRAPFGFYANEAFLGTFPAVRRAFVRFLNLINNLNDVFMVNSAQIIEWVKNPIPINEYMQQSCREFNKTSCPAVSCGPLHAEHTQKDYWVQMCNACPEVYPWLGNPFGIRQDTIPV